MEDGESNITPAARTSWGIMKKKKREIWINLNLWLCTLDDCWLANAFCLMMQNNFIVALFLSAFLPLLSGQTIIFYFKHKNLLAFSRNNFVCVVCWCVCTVFICVYIVKLSMQTKWIFFSLFISFHLVWYYTMKIFFGNLSKARIRNHLESKNQTVSKQTLRKVDGGRRVCTEAECATHFSQCCCKWKSV